MRSLKACFFSWGAMLFLLPICVGCTPGKNIDSIKAENYSKVPKSILVLYPPIPDVLRLDGFDQVFQKFANQCNIDFHSDYDKQKIKITAVGDGMISSIKPDWILQIAPNGNQQTTVTLNGSPISNPHVTGYIYNFTLIDSVEKKEVWRADIAVSLHRELFTDWMRDNNAFGQDTAMATINAMRTVGLLTSCPEP